MNKGFSDSLSFDIAEITRKRTLIRYDEYITILIELKQWEKDEKVADEMLHSVRKYVGGADRFESHPSYHIALSISLSIFEDLCKNIIEICPKRAYFFID